MLQEYFRRKNPELESKIVEKYLPYARMLAYNQAEKAGKLGDFDNIYGDAALGLLNAIRNYDPQEGVKFETYATYKIRGAILDGVRKMTGFRVPPIKNKKPLMRFAKNYASNSEECRLWKKSRMP